MKTVVLGASPNKARYSNLAVNRLMSNQHEVVPVGIRSGEIGGLEIQNLRLKPDIKNVDTITMYVGPQNQKEWYDYIIGLNPRRVIFNPGAENQELQSFCEEEGIETVEACTLVMLSAGTY